MNYLKLTLIALAATASLAHADKSAFKFEKISTPQAAMGALPTGQAVFMTTYAPYSDWKTKLSGQYFPMEVSPVLRGMADGNVQLPPIAPVDPAQYEKQAKEFAIVVNQRNKSGRAVMPPSNLTSAKRYSNDLANVHVVQTVLATVIPKSFSAMKLNPENLSEIIANADIDHYHFRIPGTFAAQVFDANHVGGKNIKPQQAYLLSVIDFREYTCAVMKNGIRDQSKKEDGKKQLENESIYLVSDLTMNEPADIAAAEKMFGKRPSAVLGQEVLYADRIIKGARTIFLFFAEGDRTRLVLVSNIGMKSEYFNVLSNKGLFAKAVILDGMNGSLAGNAAMAYDDSKAALKSLKNKIPGLSDAKADIKEKNECEKGLAKGLIRFSQDMLGEFAGGL